MAIFKLPRIETTDRTGLTLGTSEMVYDTDLDQIFTGDGATLGGNALTGGGGGGGAEITTFEEIDDDFVLANGTGYIIEDTGLSADITVDASSLVAGDVCEVYNANLTYAVAFTGATVYGFGGGSAQDSIIGGSSVKIRHVGTKIIMI
jgi:hypothetical protein